MGLGRSGCHRGDVSSGKSRLDRLLGVVSADRSLKSNFRLKIETSLDWRGSEPPARSLFPVFTWEQGFFGTQRLDFNDAFARWHRAHLSMFTVADGRIIPDEEAGAEMAGSIGGPIIPLNRHRCCQGCPDAGAGG